jgi:hypothetical protein
MILSLQSLGVTEITLVALSTAEAEYIAQKNAATEGIWLRGLREELTLRDNTLTTD